MATKHYEYDPVSGKQVLVGTSTPIKNSSGVVTGSTYTPASTSGGVTSSTSTNVPASPTTTTTTTTGGTTTNNATSTWKPADTSGNNYAEKAGMSDLHQAALEAAGKKWQEAYAAGDQKAMDAAHAEAEAIRAIYNYSGGADGSELIMLDSKSGAGDFNYSAAPTYKDSYSAQIDKMLNDILNRDAFSYNAMEDPLYQQYSQQYQREGQRAMQDTLGQVSARTGGMASSYATSAAQQANNYYMQQMSDKIPELAQLAYSMYLDNIDLKVQDLGLLENASDREYNRYRDTMSDWRDDRNFAYDIYRDDISDQRYQSEWWYQVGQDAIANNQWQQTFDHNAEQDKITNDRDADKTAYNKALDLLASGVMPDEAQLTAAGISKEQASEIIANQLEKDNPAYNKAWDLLGVGVMPDDEQLEKAGISKEQATNILAAYKAQKASSSSSSGYKPNLSASAVVDALESGIVSDELRKAYKYYYGTDWNGDGYVGGKVSPEEAILGLNIGSVNDDTILTLANAGAIVEDEKTGKLSWANGWNEKNYQSKLYALNNSAMNSPLAQGALNNYQDWLSKYN